MCGIIGFVGREQQAAPILLDGLQRMECRGYDPRAKRTRYHILRFHWRDLLGFVLVASLFAFCVTTVAMGLDYFALAGLEVL